jgi:hypothetical protein
MPRYRRLRAAAAAVPPTIGALLLAGLTTAAPASVLAGDSRSAVNTAPLRPLEASDQKIVEAARHGARARLRSAECRKLLVDFKDGAGRPLEERLAAFAVAPDEFLATLPLLDGSSRPLCQAHQSQLLTSAGVPRIFVCKPYLKSVYQERVMAEVYLIHELLHTLGLGENPPSSQEITRQVVRRCAP